MISQIDHFEYIVVDNEAEALILECNLIKKNRPKFNVLLKDDKTYPYIKIDVKSDFPNVIITRRLVNDGSKYFGPYANPGAAKEMIDFIKQKYKIRQCRNFKSNKRVCLNYHIGRCLGPCVNNVSKEEYMKRYGHRSVNEMEVCCPYPYEDPEYLEERIRQHKESGICVHKMKEEQNRKYMQAVRKFRQNYPSKAGLWHDSCQS